MTRRSRILALAGAAVLAAACARLSPREHFAAATGYRSFRAADTTRQGEWRHVDSAAPRAVAPFARRVQAVAGSWHLLVVADHSCGDAINSVPYLAALDDAADNVTMRLLRKGEAKALLERHELDGRQATPLVLILDGAYATRAVWIERPAALRTHLEKTCTSDEAAVLRAWRTANQGQAVLEEITTLLEQASRAASKRS